MKNRIKISLAKLNESMVATKFGNYHGYSMINGVLEECLINNVLYVNCMGLNFMSVPKLTQNGLRVIFNVSCVEFFRKTGLVVVGRREGNLYKVTFGYETSYANVKTEKNTDLYNKRFGHISQKELIARWFLEYICLSMHHMH